MPLFKRIFGQGKNKASNKLVALCIGDYSLIISSIEGKEAHQLQALLAHDAPCDEGSPSTSQATQTGTKNSLLGSQTSFRGFRHLLQHWGGGSTASASSTDGTEIEAQQQLTSFLKNLGGYPDVSFVTPGEDGLVSRDKVLTKLTKLFKHSTAPVVFVSYCGPSDERGNWRLATQVSAGSAGSGGGGLHGGVGGSSGAAAAGTTVLSFREVSMLWQRYRKHSQRLVLLLDCANSGYWVSALRMLSKAEQLELSLGVQASDCSLQATQTMQLTYQPGIFTQFYLTNNKWRRADSRRNASNSSNHQPQQQQQQDGADAAALAAVNASVSNGTRGEQWLPGMLPTYYGTWLNDHLVDYGIALRFFNTHVHQHAAGGGDGTTTSAPARPGGVGAAAPGDSSRRNSLDPLSPLAVHQRAWRANTGPLAAIDSSKSLGRASRVGDEMTSPSTDPWCSPRTAGLGTGAGSFGDRGEGVGGEPVDHRSLAATLAVRAVSMQESARRRFSSLYYDNCTTDGAGHQPIVGSPNTPTMQRVRLSTPQAEWRIPGTNSMLVDSRSPLGPGDESMYKFGQDTDASGSTLPQVPSHVVGMAASVVASPSASGYGDHHVGFTSGSGSGVAGGGAAAGGRLHGRSSGPIDGASAGGTAGGIAGTASHSQGVTKLPQSPPPPASPPRVVCGVAVHPDEVDVGEDDVSAVVVPDGGGDEMLVVQHSAQSDSVAVTWDRRSTHAERCLVDERQAGVASSFTNPSGQNGFVNELYGALHVVATDRRLRARRAPLEGDESLDAMMEDEDLRASVASLPSLMLPQDYFSRAVGAAGGAGGGGGGRIDSGSSIVGLGMPSDMIIGAAPPPSSTVHGSIGGGGGGSSSSGGVTAAGTAAGGPALPTPRTSALLAMAVVDSVGDRSSMHQRRQLSRLFMMSVADRTSGGGRLSVGQMEDLAEAEGGGGGGGGDEMDELSMTASYDAESEDKQRSESGEAASCTAASEAAAGKDDRGRSAEKAAGRHATVAAAAAAAFGVRRGIHDAVAGINPSPSETSGVSTAWPPALGEAAAAGSRPPMAPTSLEWPQPAESPAPSGVLSTQPSDRIGGTGRGSALPSGVSGSVLRNLLRQHVSIADSMDLDSTGMGVPTTWQRRPGRFEMAGSESSSFVFGDDQERFDFLRQLRGEQPQELNQQQQQSAGSQSPPQLRPQVEQRQFQDQPQRQHSGGSDVPQGGGGGGSSGGAWRPSAAPGAGGTAAAREEADSRAVADGWLAPAGSSEVPAYQADMLLSLDSGDASVSRQISRS